MAIINQQGWFEGFKYFYDGSSRGFWVLLPIIILWFSTLIFSAIGFVDSFNHQTKYLIAGIVIYKLNFIFILGPVSTPRFMVPIVPIIIVFSGKGIAKTIKQISSWNKD